VLNSLEMYNCKTKTTVPRTTYLGKDWHSIH
jgi:hypothetical protein